MQIVLTTPTTRYDLDVVVHDPDATVGDLLRALGSETTTARLAMRGEPLMGDLRLDRSGITQGSEVTLLTPSASPTEIPPTIGGGIEGPDAEPGALVAAVIGGLDAGGRTHLTPGSWPIGRDVAVPDDHHTTSAVIGEGTDDTPKGPAGIALTSPTVSGHHATLRLTARGRVEVSDVGSVNGTWLGSEPVRGPVALPSGAPVRLGAQQLTVRPALVEDRPTALADRTALAGATVAFNRPPRDAPPPGPEPLDPPEAPKPAPGTSGVGIASIIAPVLFGVVLVVVLGNLLFGLFALLSPVMMIANAIESRRRRRKGTRRERQRFEREVAELATALVDLAAERRARLDDDLCDPAEVLRRAELPSTRLWERRPGHHDTLALRAGLGPSPWSPPVRGEPRTMPPEVRSLVSEHRRIPDAPVAVDLAHGGVVGVAGPRAASLAVARSLVCQAAVHHGPADLPIVICAAAGHAIAWDWAKWLPHSLDPAGSGRRTLAADRTASDALLRAMTERASTVEPGHLLGGADPTGEAPRGPASLVVLDDVKLTAGRRSPARSVLRGVGGPVAGVVIAPSSDRLPSVCSAVIELTDDEGSARLLQLSTGELIDDVLTAGVSPATARRVARALARYEDPELALTGAGLPTATGLLPLLDLEAPDADAVARRWERGGADPDLIAPIGIAEDGVLALDLVRDGPHGLVGGTTGSGKSELLRSLVASLAAGSSPDHLTFVLIDFKGGSAFAECARLPHTVGMVTDLDAQLAERALRCLEAELRHRERILGEAGASDLSEYRRGPGSRAPLPRLVVVIDEFATLKTELPEFVTSLLGIAQRGRSLGVHLILATQRPGGAVDENIRANTNLRIALRVQQGDESSDIVGVGDAAAIGRDQPGRAMVRLGPGEVVTTQTALVSGVGTGEGTGAVELWPFAFGSGGPTTAGREGAQRAAETATDLARLVDALVAAHAASGQAVPRRPWPEPLPPNVDLAPLTGGGHLDGTDPPPGRFGDPGRPVHFALADDPDAQTRHPIGWSPAEGNLLLVGIGGSGTTTAAGSLVLAATAASGPDELHVHIMDFGAGELAELDGLAQVGSVIGAGEHERQLRLVRQLRAEVNCRRADRALRAGAPRWLVVLDGYAAFRAEWEDSLDGVADDLVRCCSEGPEVGIHFVVTADRMGAVPAALATVVRQRWLFRQGDPSEFQTVGIRADEVPDLHPGGAVLVHERREAQVGRPAEGTAATISRIAGGWPRPARSPAVVGELPSEVDLSAFAGHTTTGLDPLRIPIGIGETSLGVAELCLFGGEHATVAGPPRSGRSTALATMLAGLERAEPRPHLAVVVSRRSPLRSSAIADAVIGVGDLEKGLTTVADHPGPVVVLVDDAERFDDDTGAFARLLATGREDLAVIAAGRNDALRTGYGHWSRGLRGSRAALLLQPDADLDGDLAGTQLPRRAPVRFIPGRGYLMAGGEREIVQVARERA